MTKRPTIAQRDSRVLLCSMDDVVQEAGYMRLFRKGIYSGYAMIEPARGGQQFAPNGMVVEEPQARMSHRITMNYRADMLVSTAAWIYQEFRKSPPRWFKILRITEEVGCSFIFDCRLVERSDSVTAPVASTPSRLVDAGVDL